jgi:hypothetical protein
VAFLAGVGSLWVNKMGWVQGGFESVDWRGLACVQEAQPPTTWYDNKTIKAQGFKGTM